MRRNLQAGSVDAVAARSFRVIPPQAGRLVPFALSAVAEELDAASVAVATGGLNQRQIDDIPLAAIHAPLLAALPGLGEAMRRLLSKARRHP